jgi:HEPN domain-containing protein
MVDASIINEWVKKADEDLHFAESSLHDGSEFYAQICFHFQQSAEKYLKTFIISRKLPFNKVHDLVNLLKTCAENDPTLADLKEDCITLNSAYIETRYPVHWPTDYSKESATQSLAAAQSIAFEIRKRLAANQTE